jgi:nucleotide-binding universal stress UspA family protein
MSSASFQRILVPVDFVPAEDETIEAGLAIEVGNQALEFARASEEAVRLAATIARGSGGTLRLVHATPPMTTGSMYTGPVSVPAELIDEIHGRAKKTSLGALEVLRDRHCKEVVKVDLEARPGIPLDLVLEEASRFGADLIVMAASGRSRVARFFVGSTADRVIRQAHCPVLVVPAGPG